MHDIKDLEGLGVPAVGVATTEFVDAAEVQNRYLGYDPAVIFVAHPIQDRTRDEIRALADRAFDQIVALATGQAPPEPEKKAKKAKKATKKTAKKAAKKTAKKAAKKAEEAETADDDAAEEA